MRAKSAGLCLAMLGIGLLIALPHLGPTLLLKNEIDRAQGGIAPNGIALDHVFTTVFGYGSRSLPADISMRSFFVTVPVLLGLFFIPWTALRKHRALVALFAFAALLLPAGWVFSALVRLVPSFGFSRFPIADYRALAALPVVLLGVLGIERLLDRNLRFSWGDLVRTAALCGFFAVGAERFKWRTLPSAQVWDIAFVLGAFAALVLLARIQRLPRLAVLFPMALLVVWDGNRMHTLVSSPWNGQPNNDTFEKAMRELQQSAQQTLAARPAREQNGWCFGRHYPPNLNGYLRGRWVGDDYGPSEHLRVMGAARGIPAVAQYLYAATQPKVLSPAPAILAAEVAGATPFGSAVPVSYSAEQVVYDVTAPADGILVENEPDFAGWHGYADCNSHRTEVATAKELWPLRAWKIPAGHYRFCATYRLPGLRMFLAVAAVGLLAWLAAAVTFTWRNRRKRWTN